MAADKGADDLPKDSQTFLDGVPSLASSDSFVSRYDSDYEHIKFLSKGGFGLVFQAKNKLDLREYAIKRIPLSNCAEDLEKAQREVIALAKLEHPNILRYFTSWVETPPAGWQDKHLMFSNNSTSSSIEESDSGIIVGNSEHSSPSCHSIEFRDTGSSQTKDASSTGSRESGSSKEIPSTSEELSYCSSSIEESDSGIIVGDGKRHTGKNEHCSAEAQSGPVFLYIRTELCETVNLKEWLIANPRRRDRRDDYCLRVFEQILDAVEYIHGKELMHRDLKPSNIFFLCLDNPVTVKVGDFGLVKALTTDDIDSLDNKNHTSQVGTKLYMSPEQEGNLYTYKVDIFSLGLIFFELFCPFGTENERIKVMSDLKNGVFPSEFEAEMPLQSELVQWLLSAAPEERPDAIEIKNSDILEKIKTEVMKTS